MRPIQYDLRSIWENVVNKNSCTLLVESDLDLPQGWSKGCNAAACSQWIRCTIDVNISSINYLSMNHGCTCIYRAYYGSITVKMFLGHHHVIIVLLGKWTIRKPYNDAFILAAAIFERRAYCVWDINFIILIVGSELTTKGTVCSIIIRT